MRNEELLCACLVDGDVGAKRSAKKLRGRALAAALTVEAAVVVVLALWPVITPGSAPVEIVTLPRIPYHSSEIEKTRATHPVAQIAHPRQINTIFFQPVRIPAHIDTTADNVSPPSLPQSGLDLADVPGNPDAFGNGAPVIAPPKPPSNPRVIRRSEGVQSGLLMHQVDPHYPQLALNAGISGTVELRAIIGRDGGVRSVEVLSGSALLAPAAVAAVRQWRYRPTLLDGEAVEVETLITVRFVLEL